VGSKHYAFIPEETLLHPEYRKLRATSRLLFVYMANRRAGADTWFSYSYTQIRKDSRLTYNTIAGGIRELETPGFIEHKHGGLEVNHNMFFIPKHWLEL
jgi:hypothetical protein